MASKDFVCVLGASGSGKSTFDQVYFFQNQKMIAEFSKDNNNLQINDFNVIWFNQMVKPFIEMYIFRN